MSGIGQEMYWYWLCRILGISRKKKWQLLGCYGGTRELYHVPDKEISEIPFLSRKEQTELIKSRLVETERQIEEEKEKGICFFSCHHPEYPEKLRQIPDYPMGIWVKGNLPDPRKKAVAIVGARVCTSYGHAQARMFAEKLSSWQVQIVSGLAEGIDGIGHRSARHAGGKTFGVLGCGVDICYPMGNWDIYHEMCSEGGVISEFPCGIHPETWYFPQRNRIISGLSDAVLVIEAKKKSGSLITADQALEQGRDVFAVPGRIGDQLSEGCNELIRQGAGILLSPEELKNELHLEDVKNRNISKKISIGLATHENMLYSCLDFNPRSLDELVRASGLPLPQVTELLLALEIKGYIVQTRRNYYIKKK